MSGFWNFSWYELSIYDQPAIIDYILERTNEDQLYYIGYSQGATTLMALLSEKPEYNAKIRVASLMAPVGYITLPFFPIPFVTLAQIVLELLKNREVLPRSVGQLASILCAESPSICNEALNFIFGKSENQRNAVG